MTGEISKPKWRPAFGTAPIRCGKTRCKWRGFETMLVDSEKRDGMTHKLCPLCGCDSYSFMTEREIEAWERSKVASAAAGVECEVMYSSGSQTYLAKVVGLPIRATCTAGEKQAAEALGRKLFDTDFCRADLVGRDGNAVHYLLVTKSGNDDAQCRRQAANGGT